MTESYHLTVVPCNDLHGTNGSYFYFIEFMRSVVKSMQNNESSRLTKSSLEKDLAPNILNGQCDTRAAYMKYSFVLITD